MEMSKIKRDPKKVALAQAILDAYQPKSAEEMNDALKDLFGPMFEAMLKGDDYFASRDPGPSFAQTH